MTRSVETTFMVRWAQANHLTSKYVLTPFKINKKYKCVCYLVDFKEMEKETDLFSNDLFTMIIFIDLWVKKIPKSCHYISGIFLVAQSWKWARYWFWPSRLGGITSSGRLLSVLRLKSVYLIAWQFFQIIFHLIIGTY